MHEAVLDFQVLSEGTDDEGVPTKKVCSSSPTAPRRLVRGRVRARRPTAGGRRPRGVRALARAHPAGQPQHDRPQRPGGRRDRRRAQHARRLGRFQLRVHACSSGEALRSPALSHACSRWSRRRPRAQDEDVARGRPGSRRRHDRRGDAGARGASWRAARVRPRARFLAPVLPEPTDSLGIREVVLAGGTAQLEVWPPRSSSSSACRCESATRSSGFPSAGRSRRSTRGRARCADRARDGAVAMDAKKEIKLSDIFRRNGRSPRTASTRPGRGAEGEAPALQPRSQERHRRDSGRGTEGEARALRPRSQEG